jgi:putative resolvase
MDAKHRGSTADKYITGSEIRKRFHVSNGTLQRWANDGKVGVVRLKSAQGKRLYKESDLENVITGFNVLSETEVGHQRVKVCYARVSSAKQKEDLVRQIELLRKEYPEHEIVKDIGSGINWKRAGFTSLLDRVMRGDVEEVVVSHRDRLCRFAFDLVKRIFDNAACKLVVHDETTRGKDGIGELESAETELRDDLLAIVTVFVASNNGRRAAAHRRERREAAAKEKEETGEESEKEDDIAHIEERHKRGRRSADEVHEIQNIPKHQTEGAVEVVGGCNEVGVQQSGREAQLEAKGNERVVDIAAAVGGDGGRGMEEERGRGDSGTLHGCAIRDTGLATARRGRSMRVAAKQGEDTAPPTQVPKKKRRHVVSNTTSTPTQLQDGSRECVANAVRDGVE